ncbi:MAG TPA: hypothetical protein VFH28_06370 [Nitrososphaera sp.]|jgi:hypothetical protein|nr:hypothetical protein [Nitrososphaera sp.]
MTRRGNDEYHLHLFLDSAINDSSSNNNSIGGKIFRQLRAVASQRVAYIDYEQQISRWNEYQELLDKIDKKCSRQVGVRLSRNVKHNVKTFTDATTAALGIIALTALMSMWGSFTINSLYGIFGSAIALGFIGWQSFIRLYHPSIINFRCSPVLHIDEFAYMRQAIKGIPAVEHDPIVRLPVLEMDIPRAWLGQQGMLKFMESLSDLKLEDEGNNSETKRIP